MNKFIFWTYTNRTSGKPIVNFMVFARNERTYFHRLPSASSFYQLPLQNTKRPQSYQFTAYYYYISLSIRKLFCLPVQMSRQHRTAITIITRWTAADSVILWHGKKGIRSVRGNWWRTVSFLARRFLFLMHNVMA